MNNKNITWICLFVLLFSIMALNGLSAFGQSSQVVTHEKVVTQKKEKPAKEKIEKRVEKRAVVRVSKKSNRRTYVAVDLGLSVKWAAYNVGANAPEEYGGYYAWGETEEKSDYSESTYKYYDSTNKSYIDIGSKISGTKYDVAHVKWGGNWRLPTSGEIKELLDKCRSEWITYKGVKGRKFTAPNGNSIFLPAAGLHNGTDVNDRGEDGNYWSATLFSVDSHNACDLFFNGGTAYWFGYDTRFNGGSVRSVSE